MADGRAASAQHPFENTLATEAAGGRRQRRRDDAEEAPAPLRLRARGEPLVVGGGGVVCEPGEGGGDGVGGACLFWV